MKQSYATIKKQLLHDIRAHVYLPGHYMPSEHTLARRFNVSRPTVRRALDELLQEQIIAKKPGIGTVVLRKTVAASSRGLRVIAVNMAKYRGPLGDVIRKEIMNGILTAFHEHNIRLLFLPEEEILHKRLEDVDGIIWIKDGTTTYAFAQALAAKRLPVVVANRLIEQADWNCVASDHRQGMFLGVEYLLGLGHRRIALIGAARDEWLHTTRFQGYQEALAASGTPMDPDLIFSDPSGSCSLEQVREFLASRPLSAVVAFGSSNAAVVIQAATSLFRVPDQVSVLCFDDVNEWLAGGGLPITCVRQPLVEMGRTAVELMLDYVRGSRNQHRLLPCDLVVKQSCRQYPPAGAPPSAKPSSVVIRQRKS